MKRLTRVLAWLNILPVIVLLSILALVVVYFGFAGTGLVKMTPGVTSMTDKAGLIAISIVLTVLGGCYLINILPWIFLLRKRTWAWWMLTAFYGLGTALVISAMMQIYSARQALGRGDLFDVVSGFLYFTPTFLILAIDPPWGWKGKRKPSGRRKHRTSTRRKSSVSRTRKRKS